MKDKDQRRRVEGIVHYIEPRGISIIRRAVVVFPDISKNSAEYRSVWRLRRLLKKTPEVGDKGFTAVVNNEPMGPPNGRSYKRT